MTHPLLVVLGLTLTIIAIVALGSWTIKEATKLQNEMIDRDIDRLKEKYCG